LIIDASVALKWVVREDDSDAANALLGGDRLTAPDLIFSEIANSLWKKWRRGELTNLPKLAARLPTLLHVEPTAPLTLRAVEIAIQLAHPAYDCMYLALAEAIDDRVVTADRRFLAACAGTAHAGRVVALG
jgi:predicted nucleic acid-binding protein